MNPLMLITEAQQESLKSHLALIEGTPIIPLPLYMPRGDIPLGDMPLGATPG